MEYTKPPLSIEEQIAKLEKRGLIFDDKILASKYLSNISYYRLRAYTYPFQDNDIPENDHEFIAKNIHFQDIIDLYCFDRRLRNLIFNALEKIEIAFRTKITYDFAMETDDSHWFLDDSLFDVNPDYKSENSEDQFDEFLNSLKNEIDRSNEDFIKHYKKQYDDPVLPPSWMTLEVLSFGSLSRMFEYLKKKSEPKKKITNAFGLTNPTILINWLHAFAVLRNCCAHHSRIWNRRFPVLIQLPYNTLNPFMDRETIKKTHDNKIFAVLSCIKYILDIISPDSDFKKNLTDILSSGGRLLNIERDMGFPENWRYLHVWRDI